MSSRTGSTVKLTLPDPPLAPKMIRSHMVYHWVCHDMFEGSWRQYAGKSRTILKSQSRKMWRMIPRIILITNELLVKSIELYPVFYRWAVKVLIQCGTSRGFPVISKRKLDPRFPYTGLPYSAFLLLRSAVYVVPSCLHHWPSCTAWTSILRTAPRAQTSSCRRVSWAASSLGNLWSFSGLRLLEWSLLQL